MCAVPARFSGEEGRQVLMSGPSPYPARNPVSTIAVKASVMRWSTGCL